MSDWETAPAPWENATSAGATPAPAMSPQQVVADMKARPWGSGAANAIYNLGGKITDLASSAGASPNIAAAAGAATNFLGNAIPAFFMPGSKELSAMDISHNAMVAQKASILQKGKDLGLKVPPSQVNPSLTNLLLESGGGKAATAQEATVLNENVAYKIAQREAGLKPSESINPETMAAARDRIAQPYRDIAALESVGPLSQPPFKSPAQTLEELKDSRNNAKELWAYYNRSQKPEVLNQAKQASARSDQLEEALAVQASDAGRPELAQALREARMALAKNFTVERAMRGSSFDPSALSRLESRGKTPLSGDLETIMQMYRDFPKAMAAPQVGGSVGVHQLMPWGFGAAGAGVGAILGGGHGASLGATTGLLAAQSIPPLLRSAILSAPYQQMMANYAPIAPSVAPALLTYGALLGPGVLERNRQ